MRSFFVVVCIPEDPNDTKIDVILETSELKAAKQVEFIRDYFSDNQLAEFKDLEQLKKEAAGYALLVFVRCISDDGQIDLNEETEE